MTEKELKKLNRYQLLELIIIQTEELEKVKAQLAEAQQKLEQRQIQIEQAGSIANAALQLGGVFEAAQTAADMYLENIKEKQQQAEKLLADAKAQAEQIVQQAKNGVVQCADQPLDGAQPTDADTEQPQCADQPLNGEQPADTDMEKVETDEE